MRNVKALIQDYATLKVSSARLLKSDINSNYNKFGDFKFFDQQKIKPVYIV